MQEKLRFSIAVCRHEKICVSRILSRDARKWGFVARKSNISFVHNSYPPKAYFINWSQLGYLRPDFSTLPNFCTAKKRPQRESAASRCRLISVESDAKPRQLWLLSPAKKCVDDTHAPRYFFRAAFVNFGRRFFDPGSIFCLSRVNCGCKAQWMKV